MTDPRPAPMELPNDPDAPDAMRAPIDDDAHPMPPQEDPDDRSGPRPPGEPGVST